MKSFLFQFTALIFCISISWQSQAQFQRGYSPVKQDVWLENAVVVNDHIYVKYTINPGQSLDVSVKGSAPQVFTRQNGRTDFIVEYDSSFTFVKAYHFAVDTPTANGNLSITRWDVAPNGVIYGLFHKTGDIALLDQNRSNPPNSSQSSSVILADGLIWTRSDGTVGHLSKAEWYNPNNVQYKAYDIIATDSGAFVSEVYVNSSGSVSPNLFIYPNSGASAPVWHNNTSNDGVNMYVSFYNFTTTSRAKTFPLTWNNVILKSRGAVFLSTSYTRIEADKQGNIIVGFEAPLNSYTLPLSNTTVSGPGNMRNVVAVLPSHLPWGSALDLKGYTSILGKDYEGNVLVKNDFNGLGAIVVSNGQINLNNKFSYRTNTFNGDRGYNGSYITNSETDRYRKIDGVDYGYLGNNALGAMDSSYLYGTRYNPGMGGIDDNCQLSDGTMYVFYRRQSSNPTMPIKWRGYNRQSGERFETDTCKLYPSDIPLSNTLTVEQANVSTGDRGVIVKYTFDNPYKHRDELKKVSLTCDSIQNMKNWSYQANINLCMVTVNADGKNTLLWNWPFVTEVTDKIVATDIYREKGTGNFEVIATLDNTVESEFVDTSAGVDPKTTSYKYQFKHRINYGSFSNELEVSPMHKTMHLTANKGLNGEANLIWDSYEGIPTPYYYVYRDTSLGFVLIDSVSSTNFTYSDFNTPKQHQANYRVEALPRSYSCTASARRGATYTGSASNVVQIQYISSTNEANKPADRFIVYPNPSDGVINLKWNYHAIDGGFATVRDILGKTVYRESVAFNRGINDLRFNLEDLSKGVYTITLETDAGYSVMEKLTIK